MTHHTPGPWAINETDSADWRLLRGCGDEEEAVADCGCSMVEEEDGDVAFMFCRLHRAAPDLLAALKEMRGLPLRHNRIPYTLGACASSCVACQRDRFLTDAIAKAEETPHEAP